MEQRKLNIIFSKSGGTAGKGGITTKLTLPKKWIDKMSIKQEDKEVSVMFENDKIVIQKADRKPNSNMQLDISREDRDLLEKDAARKGISISEYLLMLWKKDREEYFEEIMKETDRILKEEDDLYCITSKGTEIDSDENCIII